MGSEGQRRTLKKRQYKVRSHALAAMPHGLRPMRARDVHEHRAATSLELLYDLTIVVAFSFAGSAFGHSLVSGHVLNGIVAFAFCVFAVTWAWASYSTFASGFDNDDAGMRLATLIQMAGLLVIALGINDVFHGMDEWHLDNKFLVIGYVTMRISMIYLWWRAGRDNPDYAATMRRFIVLTGIAQLGWLAMTFVHAGWAVMLPILIGLYCLEFYAVVSTARGGGTPWNFHHIVERFGLLTIITLGEVILGTTLAVRALVEKQHGWSSDAVLVMTAGLAVAFGIWWTYFALPYRQALTLRPDRVFGFAWAHLALFGAIAAVGAGLHAVALYVEGESELSQGVTLLTVAIPLALVVALIYGVAHFLLPGRDGFHYLLAIATMAVIAAAVVMAFAGVNLGVTLAVLMVAPWVSVIGYETRGHGHIDRTLEAMRLEESR